MIKLVPLLLLLDITLGLPRDHPTYVKHDEIENPDYDQEEIAPAGNKSNRPSTASPVKPWNNLPSGIHRNRQTSDQYYESTEEIVYKSNSQNDQDVDFPSQGQRLYPSLLQPVSRSSGRKFVIEDNEPTLVEYESVKAKGTTPRIKPSKKVQGKVIDEKSEQKGNATQIPSSRPSTPGPLITNEAILKDLALFAKHGKLPDEPKAAGPTTPPPQFEAFYPREAYGIPNSAVRAPHGHGSFYKYRNPALVDTKNAAAHGFRFDGKRRFNFDAYGPIEDDFDSEAIFGGLDSDRSFDLDP